jgi:hypothetical protein
MVINGNEESKKERKKERKRERKKERTKERKTHVSFIYYLTQVAG